MALLAGNGGARTAHSWINLWASGMVSQNVTDVWHRCWVLPLQKASGGVRPISLQESPVKIVEKCMTETAGAGFFDRIAAGCGFATYLVQAYLAKPIGDLVPRHPKMSLVFVLSSSHKLDYAHR